MIRKMATLVLMCGLSVTSGCFSFFEAATKAEPLVETRTVQFDASKPAVVAAFRSAADSLHFSVDRFDGTQGVIGGTTPANSLTQGETFTITVTATTPNTSSAQVQVDRGGATNEYSEPLQVIRHLVTRSQELLKDRKPTS